MNYIIQTPSAKRLREEILDCVTSKADANGVGIATWLCVEADGGERVLVHTTDQWSEKGCITLKAIPRNELQVRFHYWDTCENQENGDDKIMLGRFTELILVHFFYFVDRIVME